MLSVFIVSLSLISSAVPTGSSGPAVLREDVAGQSSAQARLGSVGLAETAWPKFHANLSNTGRGTGPDPVGVVRWKVTTGAGIESAPAIGPDRTIYFGSHDHFLYAVSPDGEPKWAFETGAEIQSSPGISADGAIYFG